jgi:hypothetical protein
LPEDASKCLFETLTDVFELVWCAYTHRHGFRSAADPQIPRWRDNRPYPFRTTIEDVCIVCMRVRFNEVHIMHTIRLREIAIMTKKKVSRDKRRVLVSANFEKFEYRPLSTADWNTLQSKLKQKLSAELRFRLTKVTAEYASFARPTAAYVSLTTVVSQIELWRKQTAILRKTIWRDNSPTQTIDPKVIGDKLASFAKQDGLRPDQVYPLKRLDQFLCLADIVVSSTKETILSQKMADDRELALWLIWAAKIYLILRDEKIPVRNENRKELTAGPILLLERLQKTLPEHLQRRKKPNALRRAAVCAFKVSRKKPHKKLDIMFQRWGGGDIAFQPESHPHYLIGRDFLDRFSRQLAALRNEKNLKGSNLSLADPTDH